MAKGFFVPGTGARYLTPAQRYWEEKRAKWDAPIGGGGENPYLDPMSFRGGQGLYRNYADLKGGTQWKADQLGKAWKEWQTMQAGGPVAEAAAKAAAEEAKFPKLRTTVEQPDVASYASAGLKALPGQTAATMTAFDKLLAEQNKETASLRESAPGVYDSSKTEAELRGADTGFRTASGDVLSRKEKTDSDYEATQNAIQKQKEEELGRYSETRRKLAQQQVDAGTALQKGAMASAGGNQGWGGAQTNRAARLFERSWVPAEAEISQKRTGLLGEQGTLEREYLGNENATMAFEQGLNERFRDNTTATAQYLQGLRTQLRGLSVAEQDNLLRREADMLGLGQRLRAGEITTAQLLAALERSATKYSYAGNLNPADIAPTERYNPGYSEPSGGGGGGGGGGGVRYYTGGDGAATQKTWYEMTPDEQRAYMNQRELAKVNAGRAYWYGPGQGLNSLSAPGGPRYVAPQNNTLPNDYTWGRTPAQQRTFEGIQRSYE